jgi:hypothetical protein
MDSFNLMIDSLSPTTVSTLQCIFTHGKPITPNQSLFHGSPSNFHSNQSRYDDHSSQLHSRPNPLPHSPSTFPAAILLLVDLFLVYGPFRTPILSFFNEIPNKCDRIQVKRAHRFMAQLGARVAGMAFLTRMVCFVLIIKRGPSFLCHKPASLTLLLFSTSSVPNGIPNTLGSSLQHQQTGS